MSNPLARTAVQLADYGWHIFPLATGDKRPRPGSAGQNDATNDVERVLSWWTETPDANIGVHCRPSGLYVIDLDRHDPSADGVESWRRLAGEHGHVPTSTVQTAGGGFHLYYRAPEGVELKNSAGKLGPGIDTRGNGYVVAPPSTVNGRPYVTCEPRRRLATLPAWVVAALEPPAPQPAASWRPPANTPPGSIERRLDDLARQIADAPDGQGNHTCAQVAYMAGQYAGAGQTNLETVVAVLSRGLDAWSFRRSSDKRMMTSTITRQAAEGARNPRAWR